jgi:hypothetical protein
MGESRTAGQQPAPEAAEVIEAEAQTAEDPGANEPAPPGEAPGALPPSQPDIKWQGGSSK